MKRVIWSLALALLLGAADRATAGFMGELWINQPGAASNATLAQAGSLGTPDATFNVPAFNFNPSDSGSVYTVGSFLNNPTFSNQSANFIANGGANANLDNTYMYFTGQAYLNAGNNSFVVGHDDGVQINFTGIGMVVNAPGPTAYSTTPFNVFAPHAGYYNFQMSYGECCGPPAALVWTINGAPPQTVPAPSSLVLCSSALFAVLGYFGVLRRKLALA